MRTLAFVALVLLAACQTTASRTTATTAPAAGTGGSTLSPQVILAPDRQSLAFNGDITFGSARALVKAIRDNPTVIMVQLTSDGGYVKPALLVANALQLRGATTFVATKCASACTVLFLGGKRRVIAAGAKLGFHRAWRDDEASESMDTVATNARIKLRLIERGVTRAFADRVVATPSEELWIPTEAELLAGGVVTEVLAKGQRP